MLIQNGQIVRPLLGVSILDSKQARQALGITKGILILEVKPGTPAAKAGLRGLKRTDSGIIEIVSTYDILASESMGHTLLSISHSCSYWILFAYNLLKYIIG